MVITIGSNSSNNASNYSMLRMCPVAPELLNVIIIVTPEILCYYYHLLHEEI